MLNLGFGLARVKQEGTPVHPDDLDWECDLDVCIQCREKYDLQLKAYNDYWGNNNNSE